MSRHNGSVESQLLQHIHTMKPGTVFAPRDLASLGSRTAVASALSRLLKAGELKQPARGLYQIPVTHPLLGDLQATPDEIAQALAGKDNLRLQPAGAFAANLLGLSDQVPQRIVYLTDGTPRQIWIGKQQIVLRRTTPRFMATAGRFSGLFIQALRHLGQRHVDDSVVDRLQQRIGPVERAQLLEDVSLAPAWIGVWMRRLAAGGKR